MLDFLDTEFTDFVRPDLISIALVSEDGREFYAERTDYREDDCSDFVRETVLPLLGGVPDAAFSLHLHHRQQQGLDLDNRAKGTHWNTVHTSSILALPILGSNPRLFREQIGDRCGFWFRHGQQLFGVIGPQKFHGLLSRGVKPCGVGIFGQDHDHPFVLLVG